MIDIIPDTEGWDSVMLDGAGEAGKGGREESERTAGTVRSMQCHTLAYSRSESENLSRSPVQAESTT